VIEVPSGPEQIVVVGDFKFFTPQELFDHWVQPDLLKYWWPEQATTEPGVGGNFQFWWPDMNWELTGRYTAFDPGKHLGFTWSWTHEPSIEPRQVDIYFSEMQDGTRMGIFHGPFSTDDAQDRQGIVEGWIHFGMRLAGLRRIEE
jgi:uncharacterized protein YndB with AHSA1/START domain